MKTNICPFNCNLCYKSNLGCTRKAAQHCSEFRRLKNEVCPFRVAGYSLNDKHGLCSVSNLGCTRKAAQHCSEFRRLKNEVCPFRVSSHCPHSSGACDQNASLSCTLFIRFCEIVCPMMVLLPFRPEIAKCDVVIGQIALHSHGVSCCKLNPDGYGCRLRHQAMILGGKSMTSEVRRTISQEAARIAQQAYFDTLNLAKVA